jgi:hypothetical protein
MLSHFFLNHLIIKNYNLLKKKIKGPFSVGKFITRKRIVSKNALKHRIKKAKHLISIQRTPDISSHQNLVLVSANKNPLLNSSSSENINLENLSSTSYGNTMPNVSKTDLNTHQYNQNFGTPSFECSHDFEVSDNEFELYDNNDTNNLTTFLKEWNKKYNVQQNAMTDLLHHLNKYFPELPLDSRTLLKTPRNLKKKNGKRVLYSYWIAKEH